MEGQHELSVITNRQRPTVAATSTDIGTISAVAQFIALACGALVPTTAAKSANYLLPNTHYGLHGVGLMCGCRGLVSEIGRRWVVGVCRCVALTLSPTSGSCHSQVHVWVSVSHTEGVVRVGSWVTDTEAAAIGVCGWIGRDRFVINNDDPLESSVRVVNGAGEVVGSPLWVPAAFPQSEGPVYSAHCNCNWVVVKTAVNLNVWKVVDGEPALGDKRKLRMEWPWKVLGLRQEVGRGDNNNIRSVVILFEPTLEQQLVHIDLEASWEQNTIVVVGQALAPETDRAPSAATTSEPVCTILRNTVFNSMTGKLFTFQAALPIYALGTEHIGVRPKTPGNQSSIIDVFSTKDLETPLTRIQHPDMEIVRASDGVIVWKMQQQVKLNVADTTTEQGFVVRDGLTDVVLATLQLF